jgi:hypothetical protein
VRGCSHPHGPHAGAGERRERKKCKIRLTHGKTGHTMPRTHHNTAAFERGTPACRRRPLRHAGLATLALRKLNRQSAGVPAALVSLTARGAGVSCCMTAVSETGSLALHSEAAHSHAGMCPAGSNAKLPGSRVCERLQTTVAPSSTVNFAGHSPDGEKLHASRTHPGFTPWTAVPRSGMLKKGPNGPFGLRGASHLCLPKRDGSLCASPRALPHAMPDMNAGPCAAWSGLAQ